MAEKLSDYLKTAEAAEFLGVSQDTLRNWAKEGKIQVNPVNGYRLLRRVTVHEVVRRIFGKFCPDSLRRE